ncbi:MAG: CDP-alcohol phosphatidyltransferase family protein [Acidimicrobiia bacterium]
MFDGNFRVGVDRAVKPVGQQLRRMGVTADLLTGFGLLIAAGAMFAIANGKLQLGFLLVVLCAVPDLLDGAVAKASGTSGPRGAFFDSVSDRVTDGLIFGGIAWHLASTESAHMAMLPFALFGASALISYERAKAESLGFDAKGGLMERAERIIVLCFGLLFDALLIPVLWVMLALTCITAVQRFVKVWRQASKPLPERRARRRPSTRRVARTRNAERQRLRAARERRPRFGRHDSA